VKPPSIDPITVEVIGNALLATAESMGATLIKSAFSPNIKERRDCSTALFDSCGVTIAQAEHIPLHLGSLIGVVNTILQQYSTEEIMEGDVFVANDPYVGGGTHLPDVTVISPFFYEGTLTAFAGNIAHHSDIGGRVPGGIAGDSRSIYEEGIRIPPLRIIEKGKLREDVLNFIILNCHIPDQRRLDFQGQFATNQVALRRLTEICDTYGRQVFLSSLEELLHYGERKLRAGVAKVPDGEYSFTDYLDDDGISREKIPIAVTVRVRGENLEVDFTGSGDQVEGAVNVVESALSATVFYAIKAVIDPGIPPNGGFHRAVKIVAPTGTIVNPSEPAAVGARTDTCQHICGAIFGAFSKALPDTIIAGSNDASTSIVLSGINQWRENRRYIYVEALGGGMGARPHKDGLNGVQVHITNTSNLPVESLETEYPLLVERYELIDGSGGAGRFRGGMGIRRSLRLLSREADFSSHGDRHTIPPWGLFGGQEGRPGKFILNPGTAGERIIPSKTSALKLRENDLFVAETPGGGGYGNPSERDPQLVLRDYLEGRILEKEVEAIYKVVLNPTKKKVDLEATAKMRKENR